MTVPFSPPPDWPEIPEVSAPPPAPLVPGAVFAGRYRILRHIATGGMGSVYEVLHLETDRRRALKVMHPYLFRSEEMRERFKREARVAAQIESEHIVDVFDAGVDEATGTAYLVMELLHGEELGKRLARLGRLSPSEVVTHFQQIAAALDKTHARFIVHRDLKPENVFVTLREDGTPRVKICDFGVAKVVAEGISSGGGTRSLGTPLYMAPEQFKPSVRLTPAADIYALGMMAYTLLVGEAYWAKEAATAGDVIAFAMTVIAGPPEPATRRAAARGVSLPPAFDAWFARMTESNPAARFQRASEAVRALGEALGAVPTTGTLVLATPPQGVSMPTPSTFTGPVANGSTPPVPAGRSPAGSWLAVGAAGLLAAAVVAAGAWLTVQAVRGLHRSPGTTETTETTESGPDVSTGTEEVPPPAVTAPETTSLPEEPSTVTTTSTTTTEQPSTKPAPPRPPRHRPTPTPPGTTTTTLELEKDRIFQRD